MASLLKVNGNITEELIPGGSNTLLKFTSHVKPASSAKVEPEEASCSYASFASAVEDAEDEYNVDDKYGYEEMMDLEDELGNYVPEILSDMDKELLKTVWAMEERLSFTKMMDVSPTMRCLVKAKKEVAMAISMVEHCRSKMKHVRLRNRMSLQYNENTKEKYEMEKAFWLHKMILICFIKRCLGILVNKISECLSQTDSST